MGRGPARPGRLRSAALPAEPVEQKAKVRELAGPPFEGEIVFEDHG
jgi:hypothetical protein